MDLFTLAAKLTVDSSEFSSGLTNADKQGSNFQNTLSKVTSAAKKVASALVLKKGVQTMKDLASAAAEAGDKIDKQSQALGISREAYQEWSYILGQSGSSIDSLGVSMKTLNSAILGGKDSVTELGLSFEDLSSMNMEQQFEAVVKAFQEMPESAEKSALAVELFGKNGMSLMPLLNSAADSVDELRQRFYDLGLEMSDEQIDAAVKYGDTLDDLRHVFDAIKIAIGSELMPTFQEWAETAANYAGKLLRAYKDDGLAGVFATLNTDLGTLVTNMRDSGNPVMQALADIIDGMRWTLDTVVGLFTDFDGTVKAMKESDSLGIKLVGEAIQFVADALEWFRTNGETVTGIIAGLVAAFAAAKIAAFVMSLSPVTIILSAIAALATLILTNWDGIQEFFVNLWTNVKTAVSDAWEEFSQWIGDIIGSVSEAWGTVADWFNSNVWEPLTQFFTNAWNTVSKLWTGIMGFIKGAWYNVSSWFSTTVIEPVKKFFEDLFSTMSKIWTDISSSLSSAWGAVYDVLSPIIEPIKTLFQGVVDTVSSIWNFLSDIFGLGDKTITVTTVYQEVNSPKGGRNEFSGEYAYYSGSGSNPMTGRTEQLHAKGEWNVPYDDYPAILHRGERVLTASQARQDDRESGSDLSGIVPAIVAAIREGMQGVQVNSYLDGRNLTDELSRYLGDDLAAGRFA